MGRGLDGLLISFGLRAVFKPRRGASRNLSVAIARGIHLFPFRTEPLSPSAPMVLGERSPGRVGRRRFLSRPPRGAAFFAPYPRVSGLTGRGRQEAPWLER
jgi:hypothetical protein